MGSIMNSRYWTCPSCYTQFDWDDGSADKHNPNQCRKTRIADAEWHAELEKGRQILNQKVQETLSRDWCTDPDNCKRCKTFAWDQKNYDHAGLPIGTQKV